MNNISCDCSCDDFDGPICCRDVIRRARKTWIIGGLAEQLCDCLGFDYRYVPDDDEEEEEEA